MHSRERNPEAVAKCLPLHPRRKPTHARPHLFRPHKSKKPPYRRARLPAKTRNPRRSSSNRRPPAHEPARLARPGTGETGKGAERLRRRCTRQPPGNIRRPLRGHRKSADYPHRNRQPPAYDRPHGRLRARIGQERSNPQQLNPHHHGPDPTRSLPPGRHYFSLEFSLPARHDRFRSGPDCRQRNPLQTQRDHAPARGPRSASVSTRFPNSPMWWTTRWAPAQPAKP